MCLEYLKVAESPRPPLKPVQKKLFWWMLHDRTLRRKPLKALEGQLALENLQELIHREAKVSCIPSNKTTILGEESWYYKYQKGLFTKPEATTTKTIDSKALRILTMFLYSVRSCFSHFTISNYTKNLRRDLV